MAHIGLISCVSQKRSANAAAQELYVSALFKKAKAFVEQNCDCWFILSAKYGLLKPSDTISPYNETLNSKSAEQKKRWATKVWRQLKSNLKANDRVTFLAGANYRADLVHRIESVGCEVSVPMEGLGIGRQLQWLSNLNQHSGRFQDIERFYRQLDRLEKLMGGKRLISKCNGSLPWPEKGVYLFFEPNENQSYTGSSRVVRVGTHGVSRGSKSTLWTRIRTHRGAADGRGNHRSSIFRLHVGAALSNRTPELSIESWGCGQTASKETRETEANLESIVSETIQKMSVLWLAVEDSSSPTSDRAYLERNIIGMLTCLNKPATLPTKNWLGKYSPDNRIRNSGLWNLDFLDYSYSNEFLDVFDEFINVTAGLTAAPMGSIAPRNWYQNECREIDRKQLSFLDSLEAT